MKLYGLWLGLLFLLFSVASCSGNRKEVEIKVMSFNIWMGGGNSIEETRNVITESGACIVGIQESSRDDRNMALWIAGELGWYGSSPNGRTTIISRYPVIATSPSGYGVRLKISGDQAVWVFNVHLMYCPYEPYQLNGIEYCGEPLLHTAGEAITSAWKSRGAEVEMVLAEIIEAKKEGFPVFLTGDFNEPSFQDWTPDAVAGGLCVMAVEWPATKAFTEKGELKDSYREYYPDVTSHPGYTWTPLPETGNYQEVMDRIDFVFYGGDRIRLVKSEVVGEDSPGSDIRIQNFPSDHRAVLSTFQIW